MVTVLTSAGEISVDDLGVVLLHEHVFIRTESLQWGWPGFGGWDEAAEMAAARERLSQLERAGVDTILDMTIPGLGRDPALVARAARPRRPGRGDRADAGAQPARVLRPGRGGPVKG